MSPITILLTEPSGVTTYPVPAACRRLAPVPPPRPDPSLLSAPVLMVRTPRSRPKRREALPAHVPAQPSLTPLPLQGPNGPHGPHDAHDAHDPPGGAASAGTGDAERGRKPRKPLLPMWAYPRSRQQLEEPPAPGNDEDARDARERPRGRQRPSAVDAGAPGLAAIAEAEPHAPACSRSKL